ncbi:UNVERIFIED_ORG: hypothetical protein J2Y81_003016 [Paraburkholderia sediminicola]|nr:hypothetical protein [Paraburkholderia sediminicola]
MQERTDAILDGQQPDSTRMFFDEPEGLPRTTTVKRLAIIRLLLHDEGTMTAEAIAMHLKRGRMMAGHGLDAIFVSEIIDLDRDTRYLFDVRLTSGSGCSSRTLTQGGAVLNTDTCQVVIAIHQSGTMRISRLEYQLVPADGELPSGALIAVDGLYLVSAPQGGEAMDGTVPDPAHWAVCLFPRCLWQCPALVHGIRFKTRPRERSGRWHLDKRDHVAVATSGTTMLRRG